ncbi:MAG: metallopeptidase family protein [Chloroflexi bacterium]|nr:metallopeptidase family protein [Chloroflexota bacterium]
MTRTEFERLVVQALDRIPEDLRARLDNVDIVVDEAPSREQLVGSGIEDDQILLGLYEGLPLTERHFYDMVLPDKITLFQQPIESICETDEDIIREVQTTVVHEVAHHFGIDDDRLHMLGI